MYTLIMIFLFAVGVIGRDEVYFIGAGLFAIASAIDSCVYRYLKAMAEIAKGVNENN